MSFDFGRPFAYVFEDKEYLRKLFMGAVFVLVSNMCFLGLFILLGYQRRVALQVAEGRDLPLPEWDQIGDDFVQGLKIALIYIVYFLPIILIVMCGGFPGVILMDDRDTEAVGVILMMGAICLTLPISLILGLMMPVAICRYYDSGSLGSAFQIGEVFRFAKNNLLTLLLLFVVNMILGVIDQVAFILCVLPLFVSRAYKRMVNGHAQGQLLKMMRASQGAMTA